MMNIQDFSGKYNEYTDKINQEFDRIFSIPQLPQKNVFHAMRYTICGGGKRIRPVLTAAVCDMLGGNITDAIKVGCAIECIHNYSLIHDDLPCMDNDDLRRGRPTCHKVFEENIALLAGDSLLNIAFELLSDIKRYESLDTDRIIKIIREISAASGAYGMIGGQVIDLENENNSDFSEEELKNLHSLKTGRLIRVSAVCGCICANICDSSDDTYKKVEEFSEILGLAFQIKDDILDVIGDRELLGKPVGSDEKSKKSTFVSLLGLECAVKRLCDLTEKAKKILSEFENSDFLVKFADYLLNRDY